MFSRSFCMQSNNDLGYDDLPAITMPIIDKQTLKKEQTCIQDELNTFLELREHPNGLARFAQHLSSQTTDAQASYMIIDDKILKKHLLTQTKETIS